MEAERISFGGDYALLIAGGDQLPSPGLFHYLVDHASYLVACDRGYDILAEAGLMPDLLVGDFDSSCFLKDPVFRRRLEKEQKVRTYPVRKDKTDSELGLDLLLDRGYRKAILLAGTGSRLDHSLANVFLAKRFSDRGLRLLLLTSYDLIGYLPAGEYCLPLPEAVWEGFFYQKGRAPFYLSFLTPFEHVIISLRGFDYSIEATPLPSFSSYAVSNRLLQGENRLSIQAPPGEGLFFFYSRDRSGSQESRWETDAV